MTPIANARRVRTDAVKFGGFRSQHSETAPEKQFQPGSDECCYRLGRALRKGRIAPDSWGFNFARSVLRHSKRPAWVPTPRQLDSMRTLVAELAEPDEPLIDDGVDNDRAA